MRTRLDEIVEEEGGGLPRAEWDEYLLRNRRIAERAFRHGVEQCMTRHTRYCHNGDPENVQPAPAAEKRVYCAEGNDHHAHNYGCVIDRRKGERRKHEERTQDPVRGIPAVFWFVSARVAGVNPDLRSGTDRRKS